VYAGAAREAVFSVPAVVRRIKAGFVPLALRAPAVNNPDSVPDEDERWLYQRINRARLAPQGICVIGSDGQVLAWVQMFDDDKSVLDFLDHGLKRFKEKADPKKRVITERYMRFPGIKQEDFTDAAALPAVVAEGHAKGRSCPAKSGKGPMPPGSVKVRLVGRALDGRGRPVADTVKQEHYVEDHFSIKPQMQAALAKALENTGTDRIRLPDAFARLCASQAHLGHLDVQPCLCMIPDKAENKGEWKRCEFWARKVKSEKEAVVWRVDGESEVSSKQGINGKGVHEVKLGWQGFIVVKGKRMTKLLLSAHGKEKLQYANDDNVLNFKKRDEVSFLPAGRPIDLDCGVRYGFIGEPVAADEAGAAGPALEIPDEARKHLVRVLGGPFLVFHDKVQKELKLSVDQKQNLLENLSDDFQETMKVFEKIKDEDQGGRAHSGW
jgi:hypothetical protein